MRAPSQRKAAWFTKWQAYKQEAYNRFEHLPEHQWDYLKDAWYAGYKANSRKSKKPKVHKDRGEVLV